MSFQQYPFKGGIPTGQTAARPSSPQVGDVFYNGETGVLEIYSIGGWTVCSAPPGAPTNIVATAAAGSTRAYADGGAVSVEFTPATNGGLPTSYTVTSSPGNLTATGSSSPLSVTGLTAATAYTFTVAGSNGFGNSLSSVASNSQTPQTLPQAPTIGTASVVGTAGNVELTFTAGATGGSAITNYKYSTDGTNYTAFSPAQTSSPLTITGLTLGVAVTIRLKAVTANGDSLASSASNSVTPLAAKATGGTIYIAGGYVYHKFTSTGTLTPSQQITSAEVLRVAGAGGTTGATGGAGGALVTTGQTLANGTAYTATIGAGGAGADGGGSGIGGSNGNNSNLTGGSLSLTAAVAGGGAGGGWTGSGNGANAKSGGSGGGGEKRYQVGGANVLDTGGAGTSGQGNNGGNSILTGTSSQLKFGSGGGGGAGSAGGNGATSGTAGAGGNGTSSFSAWGAATSSGVNVSGTYYYAAAAGANHNDSAPGANGTGWSNTANTGNSGIANSTKAGNSGIVIVRYQ